jgi:hypothetical protein
MPATCSLDVADFGGEGGVPLGPDERVHAVTVAAVLNLSEAMVVESQTSALTHLRAKLRAIGIREHAHAEPEEKPFDLRKENK